MTKKNDFEVIRNYDYTITLIDSKERKISFRDICGEDLEFLETFFPKEEEKKVISFNDMIQILEFFCISKVDFKNFTKRVSFKIFEKFNENILINYMPKYNWLIQCYSIQKGSFFGVSQMEKVPMTKFIAMTQIHKDAIDSINKDT
jgi:hypothetical protein